jgi:hypothetical protein
MHEKGGGGDHVIPLGDEGEGDILEGIIPTSVGYIDDLCLMRDGELLHTVGGAWMGGKAPEMKDPTLLFVVGNTEHPHISVHIDLGNPYTPITLVSLGTDVFFLHMPVHGLGHGKV